MLELFYGYYDTGCFVDGFIDSAVCSFAQETIDLVILKSAFTFSDAQRSSNYIEIFTFFVLQVIHLSAKNTRNVDIT